MSETKAIYFDGQKSVRIDDFPPEAWDIITGGNLQSDIDKLYSTVAYLYRCVSILGNSVSTMPFEVQKNNKSVYKFDGYTPQNVPPKDIGWIIDLPTLLGKVEVASTLGGRAYFERRQNILNTRAIQFDWLLPTSVSPIFNGVPNRHGFERDSSQPMGSLLAFCRVMSQLGMSPIRLGVEDVVYFWPPDYAVEIGAAVNYAGRAVLQNAGVIGSMDAFIKGYFDRGMIKATLLKYLDNNLQDDEKKRVKEWWRRIFTGIGNAFATEIVRGDFEVMTIGEGIKDLRDGALTRDEKESIAVGLGIPISKVSKPVGGLGDNQSPDNVAYIEDTILPEINWIYRVVNQQMLRPLGYSILARPQQLRVMQVNENERSQAFRNYVGSGAGDGVPVETAIAILGIHVPDDMPLEKEKEPEPAQATGQTSDELRFIRWLKNRKGRETNPDSFESSELSHSKKLSIIKQVERIEAGGSIPKDAFEKVTEGDKKKALKDWNKKMPKQRGLLNADVIDGE